MNLNRIINGFLHFTFDSFGTKVGSVNNEFLTLSNLLNKHPTFIEGTFISAAVVQCLSLLHGFAK